MSAIKAIGIALWRTALTIPFTLIKILIAIVLLLPILLSKLWHWLCKILRKNNFKEIRDPKLCHLPFPEDVMRRPDPCIYSQFYLIEQNLPVTWNNPDIWLSAAATPDHIEPDSYNLKANTLYFVHVRVHNASTDAALGVRVRLVYRPWSFNSPDLVPVEVDLNGNEVVRTVNVPGMGSVITQFNWLTPNNPADGESSHWCIQAHLFHPMDINTKNNLGQENTRVYNASSARLAPNDLVNITATLFNHGEKPMRFTMAALYYRTDDKASIELKLKSNTGKLKLNSTRRLRRLIPDINIGIRRGRKNRLGPMEWESDTVTVRNRYTGFEELKARMQKTDYGLPTHLKLTVPGHEGGIVLPAKSNQDINIQIGNSGTHAEATTYDVTLVAFDERKIMTGGVTVQFTY